MAQNMTPHRKMEDLSDEEILTRMEALENRLEGIINHEIPCTSVKRTIQGTKASITVFKRILEGRHSGR